MRALYISPELLCSGYTRLPYVGSVPVSHAKVEMHPFLLDRDLSLTWRYLPAPLRRLCARRAPRYGVLWLIIER
jgi:hypothetical protein